MLSLLGECGLTPKAAPEMRVLEDADLKDKAEIYRRLGLTLLLVGVPVMWSLPGVATPIPRSRCVYAHVISDQLTEAADIFVRAVAAVN